MTTDTYTRTEADAADHAHHDAYDPPCGYDPADDHLLVRCDGCDGHGVYLSDDRDDCSACDGFGWVDA